MRTLHHHPLYAASRTARLMLAERSLVFMPKLESPWERHDEFLAMNPAGDVPVLVTEDGIVLASNEVSFWGAMERVLKNIKDQLERREVSWHRLSTPHLRPPFPNILLY